METRARIAGRLTVLLLGLTVGCWPGIAPAASTLKVSGFVDVSPLGPGGTLPLPLAPGTPPATIQVQFGIPAFQATIQITPSTTVESETGRPVTLTDGDRVKVEAVIENGVIRATKLELEEFPELHMTGTAGSLPAAGVVLPLPHGATVDFTLTLTPGINVQATLTENTKVEHGPVTLTNGGVVRVEGVVRNGKMLVTEISAGEDH